MRRNAGCPTGTDDGTGRGTRRGTDAVRCWVQNQNQNQTSSTAVLGVSISNPIHRLGSRGTSSRRMDGRYAAGFGGVSCR